MALHHGFLHAVQLALVLEVFDADQLLAVQRRHKRQAGIEAAIANLLGALRIGMQLADHHGARATVTAGATFLGAGLAHMLAQVVEYGEVGVQGVFATEFLVK